MIGPTCSNQGGHSQQFLPSGHTLVAAIVFLFTDYSTDSCSTRTLSRTTEWQFRVWTAGTLGKLTPKLCQGSSQDFHDHRCLPAANFVQMSLSDFSGNEENIARFQMVLLRGAKQPTLSVVLLHLHFHKSNREWVKHTTYSRVYKAVCKHTTVASLFRRHYLRHLYSQGRGMATWGWAFSVVVPQ